MVNTALENATHRRKVVICATYSQLIAWARENKLGPRDVIWANRPEVLQGLEIKEEDIVRTGTPPENSAAIEEMLRTRIR